MKDEEEEMSKEFRIRGKNYDDMIRMPRRDKITDVALGFLGGVATLIFVFFIITIMLVIS